MGSCIGRHIAIRTRDRLGRLILLIPSWEGQAADPEEKQGPTKTSNAGAAESLKALDLNTPNREEPDGRRQTYRLGLKMFHHGSSVLASLNTPRRAHPHIAKLQLVTGEIIHFHIFDGSQMVCVEREKMRTARLTTLTTIEAAPTYCTSVGKVFLAYQDELLVRRIAAGEGLKRRTSNTITNLDRLFEELAVTRARGFAIDDEENEIGLRCIGAPVSDAAGRVFAAVSVSGPAARMPDVRLEGLAPLVMQTAHDISKALA